MMTIQTTFNRDLKKIVLSNHDEGKNVAACVIIIG